MHYRAYALDGATGRILHGDDIIADSDEEAIAAGRRLFPDTPIEIWCKARRLDLPSDMVNRVRL